MSRPANPTLRQSRVVAAGDLISRDRLIAWINGRLDTNLTSFEDLSTGEAYCKLLCTLRPGSLPLRKVRRGAKSEHDRMLNFKLLQRGLDKARLRREFRIEALIAGRFRDHYELLKWFKRLFDESEADRDVAGGAQGQAAAGGGDSLGVPQATPLGQHRQDAAERPSPENHGEAGNAVKD